LEQRAHGYEPLIFISKNSMISMEIIPLKEFLE
jgi:hypothetical protein